MNIADINLKLSSLAWASSNGNLSPDDVQILPDMEPGNDVIADFQRFAEDAQRFEMVWQDGCVSVRPWLPEPRSVAKAAYGPTHDQESLLKAA